MTRIDRYILFLYLRVFLICLFSLTGLLVVVQVFSNLDEFMEYGRSRGSVLRGILEYCGPYSLDVFDRISGVLALMSGLFVIAWLYRTNELTAILAAGISKGRVIRPILFATLGLLIVAWINREAIIPRFSDSLGRSPKHLTKAKEARIRPIFDYDQQLTISGRTLIVDTKSIVQPIVRLDGHSAALGKQITANTAEYVAANQEHPAGYLLDGILTPLELDAKPSVVVENRAYVLTPKDTHWLKPNQCFIVSNIQVELLEGGNQWRQYSSTWGLIRRLRSDPRYYGDDIRSSVHSRMLRPFYDLSLFLFGLPIVLKRQERHLFMVAGTGIFVVAGYFALLLGSQALGANGTPFSPSLSAWIPVLFFLPISWVRSRLAMDT